jgi:hypothetical protein
MMTMSDKTNNLDHIPNELRRLKQWAVYDKFGFKLPNGNQIDAEFSMTDLESYSYCFSLVKQQKYDGIAFYVNPKNLLTFIELKYTDDYQTSLKYAEIIKKIGSYTEFNSDGSNIIITKASVAHNIDKQNISIINKNFVKLSGNQCSMNSDIAESQGYIDQIFSELVGATFEKLESNQKIDISNMEAPECQEDWEITQYIQNNDKDDKFQKLWFADISKNYSSKKEASIELIKLITDASKSKNKAQITRIFNESVLAQELNENITPLVEKLANKQHITETENFLQETQFEEIYEWPTGRLGQLADYVYKSSNRPNKTISLLAAITIPLGFCARNFRVSNSSLNAFYLLLGNTGIGKNDLAKARSRIYKAMKPKIGSDIEKFYGNSNFASGEGLIAHCTRKSNCSLSIVSEFSGILKKISRDNRTSAEESLRILLLNLYDYGSEQVAGVTYSKAKDDIPPLDRPNVSLFAESNPKDVYDSLNEKMITSGLLPRLIIVETKAKREYNNENAENVEIPQDLLNFLAQLAKFCIDCNNNDSIVKINIEEEAKKRIKEIDRITTDEINKESENKSIAEIYNRAQVKVYKLAALLAIFDCSQDKEGQFDFSTPILTLKHVQYAEKFIMASSKNIAEKFSKGEIGAENSNEEKPQFNEIINSIKEHNNSEFLKVCKYGVSEVLQKLGICSYVYILKKNAQKKHFKNHRLGATQAIKNAIKNLIEHEEIEIVHFHELNKLGNFRGNFYRLKKQ